LWRSVENIARYSLVNMNLQTVPRAAAMLHFCARLPPPAAAKPPQNRPKIAAK